MFVESADAFGTPSTLSIIDRSSDQPPPNGEEIAEAAEIAGLGKDALAYSTMPVVTQNIFANGSSHRILHIMAGAANGASTEMSGYRVNMNNRTAERVPSALSLAGPPPAWCRVLKKNNALSSPENISEKGPGAANVVISRGNEVTPLWELTVVRPSGSSGNMGSGLEVRNVKFKGKTVLGRGHLPILNVKYKKPRTNLDCGPTYRDWQWQEYDFECEGPNVAGTDYLRACTKPPRTIIDVPIDPKEEEKAGFRGIAFYPTEDAVLIRSYLMAGWYRYTTEWTLCANGTIKPRWGFGAVLDDNWNCVCEKHHHHAYYRFDFDIETSYRNAVHEFNDPRKPGQSGNWHEIVQSTYSERNKGPNGDAWKKQYWKISNQKTGNSYLMRPGPRDANTEAGDTYGKDGAWIMNHDPRWMDDEVIDVQTAINRTIADFDLIAARSGGVSSAVSGKDVVVWYAVHFVHDEEKETKQPHDWKHLYGPDLVPEKWA